MLMPQQEIPETPRGCSFLIHVAGTEPAFCPEGFTAEQRMFAQSAQEFMEREVIPDISRLERHEPGLMVDKLRKAGELGLLMIDIPERYGGLELDLTTSMLCTEKMAHYASFSVSCNAHTGIGTLPLMYFGTEEQRRRFLPRLATGEILAAYALTEPSSGSDALNARTRADKVKGPDGEDCWKLTGTKMWITNGAWADLFTVFAKVDGRAFSAFLVEAPAEGLSIGAEEQKMGIRGSSTTQVNLDGVLVPLENLLGEIGRGHKIAFNTLNVGRFKLGVGALGHTKPLLRDAIRYAKQRLAFGQPISSFGAIRQKIADMAIRIYALESMCYRVGGDMTELLSELDPAAPDYNAHGMRVIEEFSVEDSMMKVYGSETVEFVADECLQIHGGYGFSQEYDVERSYRDSRINRIFEGTNEINRMLIPATLMKRTMKGELPLFERVQDVLADVARDKPEPPPLEAGDFAWEVFFVEQAKKLALYTANAAIQKHMANLRDEQEILLALADQLTLVYAMDSALTRSMAYPGETQEAIVRVHIAESYERTRQIARVLFRALESGATLARHDAALARLSFPCDADAIGLKRVIADEMTVRETWPFVS